MASKNTSETKSSGPRSLSDSDLKEAIELHESGRPLPSGVAFRAGELPAYVSVEELNFIDRGGETTKAMKDRVLKEREYMTFFNAWGEALTNPQVAAVFSGERPVFPVQSSSPVDTVVTP